MSALKRQSVVLGLFVVLFAQDVLACSVCYGAAKSNMIIGAKWAVTFLLGVVAAVLVAFAMFFIFLSRRAATHANQI